MKTATFASLISIGWLASSGGCVAGQAVTAPRLADELISQTDEVLNQCQFVVSSLEPAARTGRTSPVITAHLAFVEIAEACRHELNQRAQASDDTVQVASLELMLIASTHQAVLAYAEEGDHENACRWMNVGATSAEQWHAEWGQTLATEVPAIETRWTVLRDTATRERLFFDLFLTEHCGR